MIEDASARLDTGPVAAARQIVRVAESLSIQDLSAYYGHFEALHNLTVEIEANKVTAVIGPSGCGKSTFIRCLNRLHELGTGCRVTGRVLLDTQDLYDPGIDPMDVRRRVGMVFQRPNPFPTMSVFDNVASGLRLGGTHKHAAIHEKVEQCLKQAVLWEEVKGRLNRPAIDLSGGQQQRLCLARTLAVDPVVILMDEPCSALDPISTLKIEDLIVTLKRQMTIVIVTHNMQQASRVSDNTVFLLANEQGAGELIEAGPTRTIFTKPSNPRTEAYVTGRFG